MYQLDYPSRILFGWGCRSALPGLLRELTGAERPRYALVLGRSARHDALAALATALLGTPVGISRQVHGEPMLAEVDAITAELRQWQPAVVIGIGGGSILDAGKAAAILARHPGDCAEYFHQRAALSQPGIPFIALPTTSGTGTEITRNSVLADPATGLKQSLRHRHMIPVAAVVDPELTLGAPTGVTAASGLDALTQAIESYLSLKANAVTQALALQAVRLLWPALPRVCADGNDRAARTAMAEGSLLTAMAFGHSGLGAVHGLAHLLGLFLNLPHGQVCAILLPPVLRYNAPVVTARLDELAAAVGLPDGAAFVTATGELVRALGIPAGFRAAGLTPAQFPAILAQCRSNSMACNPRPMPDAEVLALLAALAAV